MKSLKWLVCSICMIALFSQSSVIAADNSLNMTYRDNAVVLSSTTGSSILSGTFQISDLCITPGQDPNQENYIGKTYTLNNHEFHFQVGRSGSEEVAEWFNERFSGYNDDSINGDRTTFDHTAGELNFAFMGDLTLEVSTSEYPNGISVTFPDVVFAQGSTLFSNNWWFGQLEGQHTLDSDGPERMLVFGSDAYDNQVFASFERGGNDTNEVTLCALTIVDEPRQSAQQLADVQAAFADLPIQGNQVDLSGFPGSYDPVVNHIQGYAQYESMDGEPYAILTHSVGTAEYAHIVIGTKQGDEKLGYKTYLKDWRHPGGIQTIGDYLLVPNEQETSATIALYDLRALTVGELRRVESFNLQVNHKAGALGITSYEDEQGNAYYVLIVAHLDGANSIYYVYQASAENGIESAEFQQVGSFALDKDFQGFGLVTESGTNRIYMIGLWSTTEGASYADYAYLYELDTDTWSLGEELNSRHLVSTGGGAGVMGVHFRYGAGVSVSENGELTVSATERNSVLGSDLATNDWVSETSSTEVG